MTYTIEVRDNDETPIQLRRVDHLSTAADAAHYLWESVYEAAKTHGGTAFLFVPEDRDTRGGHAVYWHRGPKDWAEAYVVSDGADALGFVAEAEGGETVVFRDTD